jgi:hypothetical protein
MTSVRVGITSDGPRHDAKWSEAEGIAAVVCPGRLSQDQLVQRQVCARSPEPGALRLRFLSRFACSVSESPASSRHQILGLGHLADTNLADRVSGDIPLRNQDINRAKLRDDLFGLVSSLRNDGPPQYDPHASGWTTSTGVDPHFTGDFLRVYTSRA